MTESTTPSRTVSPDAGLSGRLAALERENASLRERLAATTESGEDDATPLGRQPSRVRAIAAVILILLGVILAPLAVVASWAQSEVTDTDRFVSTIGPLSSDPAIQSALTNRLTEVVMQQVDVETLVAEAVTALSDQGLPPRVGVALSAMQEPLVSGIESFVRRAAERVVESDAFTTAWVEANRIAHEQFVAVLEGEEGNALQIGNEGQLTIQLAGIIEVLKQELVDAGFGIAANIPAVNASFTLVETSQLVQVQNSYNLLNVLGSWLPWISLGLIAAGVLTAKRRSRALVFAGLALALSMLVLGIGLYIGRSLYLAELTGRVERIDAAQAVFEQLVAYLRVALRTVAIAGLVVALAAYFGGGSDTARSLRADLGRGFASTRTWAARRGVTAGPVGTWLDGHKVFVRTAILSLAGLVIVLSPAPTPALVVTTAVVAAVLVAIVELLASPAARPAAPASVQPAAAGARPES